MTLPIFKAANLTDVRCTLTGRNYKDWEIVQIGGEACIKAFWTQTEAAAFCAEFGVSATECVNGYIICNLHQPYNPRTTFATAAAALQGWNDFNVVKPQTGVKFEVRGDYTPANVDFPFAVFDGKNWLSTEWRGSVAIRFYRQIV